VIISAFLVTMGRSKTQEMAQAVAPPEVEVVQVTQQDVPISSEWIGTLEGMVNATIKAQVTGYLRQQLYTEGAVVKEGQVLFEIDPRPFQAALDQAKGELAKAQGQLAQAKAQRIQANAQLALAKANQGKTQLDVNRYIPLAKAQAITAQDLDNAVQNNLAAKAQVSAAQAGIEVAQAAIVAAQAAVEAAEAAVATATLNLGFTTIYSPIDGIAGIATAQVGDLVGPNSGTLTTVSTLDPIKVYFTASEQAYLNFVRRNPTAAEQLAAQTRLELELILADGTTYAHKGTFFVADREVNTQTGSIRLAGLFPNPGNILRPGQYGRVRAVTRRQEGALLVPQRAVTELQGRYQVAVVDSENKINIRTVKVGVSAWARCGSLLRDCTQGNAWSSRGCRRCGPAWWCTRSRLSRRPGRQEPTDVQLLHQPPHCGHGDRDCHRPRRSHRAAGSAPGTVS
jgi:membrane fusion protein (multidrug efflux system)